MKPPLLPNQIVDLVLAHAIGSLAPGLSRAGASRLIHPSVLRRLVGVTNSNHTPYVARLALLLFKHCTLTEAASNGRLDILELRLALDVLVEGAAFEMECCDGDLLLKSASESGHLAVVEWVLEHMYHGAETLTMFEVAGAMGSASQAGQIQMLEFWRTRSSFSLSEIAAPDNLVLTSACAGGSISVLEWWIAHADDAKKHLSNPDYARNLARNRHGRALEWWYAMCALGSPGESPLQWTATDLVHFVRAAPPHLIRAKLAPPPPTSGGVTTPPATAAIAVTTTTLGDINLSNNNSSNNDIAQNTATGLTYWHNRHVLSALTAAGHASELAWWQQIRGLSKREIHDVVPLGKWTGTQATLDWWWGTGVPRSAFRSITLSAVEDGGNLDMLKWAESHKLFPKKSSDKWSWYCLQAIYLGHVHVLQWLHARGYPVNVTGASIQAASDARHVSTLNWLLRTTALPFPCETVDVLRSASNLGLVDMLQWWSDAVRPNAPHGRSLTLQYTHTAMDESPFIVVLDWWAHGDRHPHLPIKYSATAIKLSSQTGDTDLLEWWRSSSGLPLQYSHEVFEALVGDRHNDVLRWWWASGLPLKMSRHVYDRRRADVEEFFRLEPLDHDNDDTLYHERMVWWRDHIFHGKDAADRVVIVDENAVHAVQRERWLNVAAPPSLWTRISQLF